MPKAPEEVPEAPQDASEQHEGSGGTRWRRFALVAVPGFLAAGVLGAMTTQGLLAASFAVSGDSFKMSADSLSGTGFSQYGDVANSVDGSARAVGLSTVNNAELENLCLENIARFKRPREYRFVNALPKNNYGKVLKTELRERLRDG